jgi:hypothetical protein
MGKDIFSVPESAPKPVLEHEAGHYLSGHRVKLIPRILQELGIGSRSLRKRELQAWRHATPGKERSLLRRPALESYRSGMQYMKGRALTLGGLGLGSLGLYLAARKKEKK